MKLSDYVMFDGMTVEMIVWAIFGGIVLATVISYISKNIMSPLVSKLEKGECNSAANSLTLKELGLKSNRLIPLFLKSSTAKKVISSCTQSERDGNEATEQDKKKPLCYYIERKNAGRAEAFYKENRLGIVQFILLILALAALAYVLTEFAIPLLGDMLDNLGNI